jgi:hypothetical protein
MPCRQRSFDWKRLKRLGTASLLDLFIFEVKL